MDYGEGMKIQPYHVPGLDILTHENNCTCADCCNHRAIVSGRRPPTHLPQNVKKHFADGIERCRRIFVYDVKSDGIRIWQIQQCRHVICQIPISRNYLTAKKNPTATAGETATVGLGNFLLFFIYPSVLLIPGLFLSCVA